MNTPQVTLQLDLAQIEHLSSEEPTTVDLMTHQARQFVIYVVRETDDASILDRVLVVATDPYNRPSLTIAP